MLIFTKHMGLPSLFLLFFQTALAQGPNQIHSSVEFGVPELFHYEITNQSKEYQVYNIAYSGLNDRTPCRIQYFSPAPIAPGKVLSVDVICEFKKKALPTNLTIEGKVFLQSFGVKSKTTNVIPLVARAQFPNPVARARELLSKKPSLSTAEDPQCIVISGIKQDQKLPVAKQAFISFRNLKSATLGSESCLFVDCIKKETCSKSFEAALRDLPKGRPVFVEVLTHGDQLGISCNKDDTDNGADFVRLLIKAAETRRVASIDTSCDSANRVMDYIQLSSSGQLGDSVLRNLCMIADSAPENPAWNNYAKKARLEQGTNPSMESYFADRAQANDSSSKGIISSFPYSGTKLANQIWDDQGTKEGLDQLFKVLSGINHSTAPIKNQCPVFFDEKYVLSKDHRLAEQKALPYLKELLIQNLGLHESELPNHWGEVIPGCTLDVEDIRKNGAKKLHSFERVFFALDSSAEWNPTPVELANANKDIEEVLAWILKMSPTSKTFKVHRKDLLATAANSPFRARILALCGVYREGNVDQFYPLLDFDQFLDHLGIMNQTKKLLEPFFPSRAANDINGLVVDILSSDEGHPVAFEVFSFKERALLLLNLKYAVSLQFTDEEDKINTLVDATQHLALYSLIKDHVGDDIDAMRKSACQNFKIRALKWQ